MLVLALMIEIMLLFTSVFIEIEIMLVFMSFARLNIDSWFCV